MTYYNYLIDEYPLNPYFTLDKFENALNSVFNQIYASKSEISYDDTISDFQAYKPLRNHFLLKFDDFLQISEQLSEIYSYLAEQNCFEMTTNFPPELHSNIPFKKQHLVGVFTNTSHQEYLQEFLVGEPGSISFCRDIKYKNIWFRFGIESHVLFPFLQFQLHQSDFQIDWKILIQDWISYGRGFSQEILSFMKEEIEVNSQFLLPFSEQKFLLEKSYFEESYGLFFPILVFEGLKSILHASQINKKQDFEPQNFRDLIYLWRFQRAKFMFYQKDWLNAEQYLLPLLNEIKSNHYPNFCIEICYSLAEISEKLKNYTQGIEYLLKGLEFAKNGTTPILKILHLHFYLMKLAFYRSNEKEKVKHEEILFSVLNDFPNGKEKSKMVLQIELWHIHWDIEEGWLDSAKERLLGIKNPEKYGSDYEIEFNFLWGQFYKKSNNLEQMWKAYEKNFKFSPRKNYFLGLSYLEYVAEYFLQPNYSSFLYRGFQMLQKAAEFFDYHNPRDLLKLSEILAKLIEICFQLHNDDLAIKYQKQLSACHSVISFFMHK